MLGANVGKSITVFDTEGRWSNDKTLLELEVKNFIVVMSLETYAVTPHGMKWVGEINTNGFKEKEKGQGWYMLYKEKIGDEGTYFLVMRGGQEEEDVARILAKNKWEYLRPDPCFDCPKLIFMEGVSVIPTPEGVRKKV